ncbi:phosphatidate cytidylyltransferase [Dermacoccaceae bacterium W4C1]
MSTPNPPRSRREARDSGSTAAKSTSRAGRDLPMAIGVGAGLGILVLASLLFDKRAFVVLASLASVIGAVELLRALSGGRSHPPVPPTLLAAAAIPPIAYIWGPEALTPAVVVAVLLLLLWGAVSDGPDLVGHIGGGVFVVLYVPMLVAFAMLLLRPDDGVQRIITFILVTVASDIGGYAVGVLFGRHPMAPTVSPKKSWEGFTGSAVTCMITGALCVALLLDGDWWVGVLLGMAVVVAATVGDLCESMIKRDLGIKDMSNLIPGHGGLMDRLDSLVVAVPVTWAILTLVSA